METCLHFAVKLAVCAYVLYRVWVFLTYLGKHGTCTGTKLNCFIFQQAATKLQGLFCKDFH